MSYSKDYKLALEYETETGENRSYSELVHSYQAGFKALEIWLWKNRPLNYILISATIKEI